MLQFCHSIPKIELHAHLNGSLSPETLKQLGCFDNSVEEYQMLNRLQEKTPETLNEAFPLFKIAHNATKTKESLYVATTHVISEFFEDNVVYLELRTTPRSEENLTKEEYVETVVTAIRDNRLDIVVKLILSVDRRHDENVSRDSLDLMIKMKDKHPDVIKGIDLGGNPSEGRFDRGLFVRARQNGLKVTLHCAEIKNDKETIEMLEFKPERIGHGTCVHYNFGGSKEVWEKYLEARIPVECCLTSNVVCGTSKSFNTHHVKEWINDDLPFVISTDDKGVFCTSLSKEFYLLQENFNLTKEKIWRIIYDSVEYIFDDDEKENLRNRLNEWKSCNMELKC